MAGGTVAGRVEAVGRAVPLRRVGPARRRRAAGPVRRRGVGTRPPRPRSRPWWSGTGRWSWASAAACWATGTRPRTRSRRRSWSWRKAGAIARREQLANWLHGVASRTALDARARADRRRARERKAFAMSPSEVGPDDGPERGELRAILDEELARLPASYRGAVVLCELDGLSRQAAARRLGIPEGTLSSRLARAKDLLRHRLTRRGLAPSVVALEAALAPRGPRLPPPALAGGFHHPGRDAGRGRCLPGRGRLGLGRDPDPRSSQRHVAREDQRARPRAWPRRPSSPRASASWPRPRSRPGPPPTDDRLGAVEQKLDRILEALGSTPWRRPRAATARRAAAIPARSRRSRPARDRPPVRSAAGRRGTRAAP